MNTSRTLPWGFLPQSNRPRPSVDAPSFTRTVSSALRRLPSRSGREDKPEFISASSSVYGARLKWPAAAAAGRARQPGQPSRHYPMRAGEVPMIARLKGMAGALAVAVLAGLVLMAMVARAQEKAKDLDKIPKKVMDALKAKFPKAEIHKWTKEKEGDNVVYDIEFKQDGRKFEADIKEDGTILNFEKEIAAKDLPKAVIQAVEKKYPNAKLKEVMEITEVKDKKETPGGYEIVLETANKKEVEVTVAPDGKILEDSGEKKEKK